MISSQRVNLVKVQSGVVQPLEQLGCRGPSCWCCSDLCRAAMCQSLQLFYCCLPRWSQVLHGNTDLLLYISLVWLVFSPTNRTLKHPPVELLVWHVKPRIQALSVLPFSLFFVVVTGGFPSRFFIIVKHLCYNVEGGRRLRRAGRPTLGSLPDSCFIVLLTDSLMTGDSLIGHWSHRADKMFFQPSWRRLHFNLTYFLHFTPAFKNNQRHI